MVPHKVAAISMCLALGTCVHVGSLCAVGPSQPDPGFSSRWTHGEKVYAFTLNRAGEDVCGWQVPAAQGVKG